MRKDLYRRLGAGHWLAPPVLRKRVLLNRYEPPRFGISRYNDFRRWADGRPLWVVSRPDRYDTRGEERGCAKFIFTTLSHFSARQI